MKRGFLFRFWVIFHILSAIISISHCERTKIAKTTLKPVRIQRQTITLQCSKLYPKNIQQLDFYEIMKLNFINETMKYQIKPWWIQWNLLDVHMTIILFVNFSDNLNFFVKKHFLFSKHTYQSQTGASHQFRNWNLLVNYRLTSRTLIVIKVPFIYTESELNNRRKSVVAYARFFPNRKHLFREESHYYG